ncbi:NLI interacting factor, partial [Microstroma glucosiphilum]
KILVLDLDETLIHSTSRSPTWTALRAQHSSVNVVLDGRSVIYHVYKRPWVDYFLRKVSTWYQVVIFTASVQEYGDPVIDWLDQGRGLIAGRLYRDACTYKNGSYLKDLSIVDLDLSRVCLVDNSPASYFLNPSNGIPIEGWTHDPSDEALLDLLPVLDSLRFAQDVRHVLGLR